MDAYQPRRFRTDKPGSDVRPPSEIWAPGEPANIPLLNTPLTIKYAEWREELKPRPTVWGVAKQELKEVPTMVFFALISLFVLTVVLFRRITELYGVLDVSGAIAVAGPWLTITLGLLYRFAATAHTAKQRDAGLREKLQQISDGSDSQIPVEISLACERFPFDRDVGYLSVVDGCLYFSGLRTVFSFSPRAARRPTNFPHLKSSFEFYRHGLAYTLRFRSLQAAPFENSLWALLQQWTLSARSPGSVEVLPPTRPSTDAERQAISRSIHAFAAPVLVTPIVLGIAIGLYQMPRDQFAPGWLIVTLTGTAGWLALVAGRCVRNIRRDRASLSRLTAEDLSQVLKL